ncbi:TIGR04076 family protein [Desulfovibrio sp. JC010]|uniref:TIGR04076 family protein n=1 Tax=Desulfovibrio sp. JC010 TaxID=2593641 RepID=UPI0013D4FAB5|nr:TIGR04076 family protein [Desulfovibrio sp. JC010]NDV27549.1 TIGR04076 family protein [Desulfovibrio sp. JC010]
MSMCKITVIRRMFNEDFAREFCKHPAVGPCEMLREGQEFVVRGPMPDKPHGFCSEAWAAIDRYVFAFCLGGGEIFNGSWMKRENEMIACCNDGVRPVVFKLERID